MPFQGSSDTGQSQSVQESRLGMIVAGGLGGGGCAVPAVLTTRTLRDPRDRLIAMPVAPTMNCGAKMPVYLMLVAAFFARAQAQMMFLLWLISWAVALMCAWTPRRTSGQRRADAVRDGALFVPPADAAGGAASPLGANLDVPPHGRHGQWRLRHAHKQNPIAIPRRRPRLLSLT